MIDEKKNYMKVIKKEGNIIVFEHDLTEKYDMFIELGYAFVENTNLDDKHSFDLICNGGTYCSPGYNFPIPDAKKLKITIEVLK